MGWLREEGERECVYHQGLTPAEPLKLGKRGAARNKFLRAFDLSKP